MMKTFSRWLSPVALLAWSTLLLYFYGSGRINHYLVPVYRPGVALAGAVMLGIAACQFWNLRYGARWQQAAGLIADDCADEITTPGRVWVTQGLAFVMLVVPMWAAVGMSNDQFGAAAVLNRGIVNDASNLPGKLAPVAAPQPPAAPTAPKAAAVYEPPLPGETPAPADSGSALDAEQYLKKSADGHIISEVTDLLFAAEDDSIRPIYEKNQVELVGQFMPDKERADGRFNLVRMFMVCCAADARPVAVGVAPAKTVGAPKTAAAKLPVEMAWTRVVGTVTFPMENGRRIALVHAQSVAPCDPPSEAMLY